jgi:hypothetical protein
MDIVNKLDEHGKGAWIGVMILSFILFWPAGLAILAYLSWSGRMKCWKMGRRKWHNHGKHHHGHRSSSSGNSAFDDYREETLKRLEDEQSEFEGFLDRLRQAKDKSEFDQFMDERRNAPPAPEGQDSQPGA